MGDTQDWSLYKRNGSNDEDIFDTTGDLLEPLCFSNGKTQQEVVGEVMQAIAEGHKIIFVHGVCGSGKSAMALNLANNFKRTSIIVPIKSLQEQYEIDYTKKMFVVKANKKPLSISIIKGRNNFPCNFSHGKTADDQSIPCTIELREKNTPQIFSYLEQNELVDANDFTNISEVRRMNVAPTCPYWAPMMPSNVEPKFLGEHKKIKFDTVSGKEFALFQRKRGCPYYEQYESYAHSDVLIFNATKYLIECALGRKPKTDIEIIDECDEFLDSFANEKRINLNRLYTAMSRLMPNDQDKKVALKELLNLVNDLIYNKNYDCECEKIEPTRYNDLFEKILENPNLAEDEEFNYYNTVLEVAKSFEGILDSTYVAVDRYIPEKKQDTLFGAKNVDEQVTITLVSINLAEKFKELLAMNKVFVMMSGTLHEAQVVKDIFGIDTFKIIEAENKTPGEIKKVKTGLERNCSYANFNSGSITRLQYLKILDASIGKATRPTLVHVNAFSDLPSEKEQLQHKFHNLITREQLHEEQRQAQKIIREFHEGKKDILFTTKCSRGVDFADDKCRSIIMTRFPYPNISGLFWKILKKEQPDKFMEFYLDKARRELIQKVARGVRNKTDWVELLSPDSRVMNTHFD